MIKKYMPLLISAVVLIVVLIFVFGGMGGKALSVDAFKVSRIDVVKTILSSGTIEAVDYEDIKVPSGQKVLKVYTSEKQKVTKGQLLVQFDTGDSIFALKKAEIAGQQLAEELSQLAAPTTVSEREVVKNSLAQAEIDYKDKQSKLKESEDKQLRDKQLYEAGYMALVDYNTQGSLKDAVASQAAQSGIALENARNKYKDYDKNKALLIKERERQIASNTADKESLNKKIADSMLKASMDGTVAEFELKENRIPQDGSVIKIYDLTSFNFKGEVPQEDAILLKEGQPAVIRLKGVIKEYKAVVSEIKRYASVDIVSGSRTPKVKITLSLKEAEGIFTAGFDADTLIEVGHEDKVLAIRKEAILKGTGSESTVFVVKDGKIKMTKIVTGLSDDYMVEVRSGINEGDVLVNNPPQGLKDGTKVKATVK